MKPKILIITGYGVNCEAESSRAWELAGAEPVQVHLNDLLDNPAQMRDFRGLMFIGGFSYGDHMTSGHVFALRVKHHLREELQKFIDAGKIILGVCNGFQTMTKIGLLPGLNGEYFDPKVALMQNDCGTFQNFWVNLKFEAASPCIFTKGLSGMPMPIRHGEGKIFTTDKTVIEQIETLGCAAARYADADGNPTMDFPANPNGSLNAIAGLCDPTGRIFGLMPHPEAYLFPENHPNWDVQKLNGTLPPQGLGLKLFENGVKFLAAS
ncbi:MAG: phosphoribosylformylglycinamidine synthase subunit PurQ [Kiritimatiellales bacterium]|nr:phosphoribosylformylglycinamidine synthase subunit PurQ [Kiritimatiellales bacterium]